MRGKRGCEKKVDRERKGTRRECHAYNTVQGGFFSGAPFLNQATHGWQCFSTSQISAVNFYSQANSNTQQEC